MNHSLSRREFLASSSLLLLATAATCCGATPTAAPEPIIDIHQHTNYSFRTDEQLLAHQKAMDVTQTILLPAGSLYGLEANATGNQACYDFVLNHPGEYVFFANEVAGLPGARAEIEKWLKKGALGIGEQKFQVNCDSPGIEKIAEIAQEHRIPVLLHFQHNKYNTHIERFHKILEKYPNVNFIGHAQTWWSNIDKNCDQTTMYPTGKITPGGITDRLLADYPNMYGDLSAGSGLNALNRDPDFTTAFLDRHQNKLLYGSDCNDVIGRGPSCSGAQTIVTVRKLVPSKIVERKLLYDNAKKMFKL
ncbi:MAG: putative metal-dependent hydrolase of the TIM-barrel fold protein [Pedosphaera sp.]|nr:putative metal-dependent hydrolase of the TIM-barrel fold protein [Pedosphaera sp.]